jgi:Holliday junction resolvase
LLSRCSWSRFGRDGEFVVAIYLNSCGWNVQLSRGSRGPADIIATRGLTKWLIQVKSSRKLPSLKGQELKYLRIMAESADGLPVIATVQAKETVLVASTPNTREQILPRGEVRGKQNESTDYGIYLYSLVDWKLMHPT